MKLIRPNVLSPNVIVTVLIASVLLGATTRGAYEIDWYTIDGGGGESAGGTYSLTGTAGQSDPGVMSGGDYVLSGGFWPGTYGCIVGFTDLANFCAEWLMTDAGLDADLGGTQGVDFVDFSIFAYYWLYECPPDWPLK